MDQENRGALALFGSDGCVRLDAARGRGNEWMRLNDLHRASGQGESKEPGKWLATCEAQELAKALQMSQPQDFSVEVFRVVRGGNDPHTDAHWVLATGYSEWLSPAFHLRVIREWRAFNELKTSGLEERVGSLETILGKVVGLLEAGNATVSRADFLAMRRRFLEVADLQVAAKQAATRKSASNSLRSRIFGLLGWTGTGSTDRNMPAALWPHVRRMLDAAARDAQRAIGIQAEERQQDLFTRH